MHACVYVYRNYSIHCLLQHNGKPISWRHLEDLYIQDSKQSNKGTRLVPKLKYEHVYLTPFSRMQVDLAAQVSIYTQFQIYQ